MLEWKKVFQVKCFVSPKTRLFVIILIFTQIEFTKSDTSRYFKRNFCFETSIFNFLSFSTFICLLFATKGSGVSLIFKTWSQIAVGVMDTNMKTSAYRCTSRFLFIIEMYLVEHQETNIYYFICRCTAFEYGFWLHHHSYCSKKS